MDSPAMITEAKAKSRSGASTFWQAMDAIDALNDRVGNIVCLAFILIILIQLMEVVLRYVFRAPTIWAWDVNSHLFTAAAVLGGGYALLNRSHVNLDVLYSRVNPRKRFVFDLIGFPLVLLAFAVVIWKGGEMAWYAWETQQRGRSYFAPILWPVKSTIFIGGILIFLQAISNYSRTIASYRKGSSEEREASASKE